MYSVATGWLGWSPSDAWTTPLPELFLAMDARIEWTKITNPFSKPEPEKPKPTTIAQKLRAVLTGRTKA